MSKSRRLVKPALVSASLVLLVVASVAILRALHPEPQLVIVDGPANEGASAEASSPSAGDDQLLAEIRELREKLQLGELVIDWPPVPQNADAGEILPTYASADELLAELEDMLLVASPEISIFLKDTATAEEIQRLREDLEARRGVLKVVFISKEEALSRLRQDLNDHPEVLQSLEGNPLPASLEVEVEASLHIDAVVQDMEPRQEVDEVRSAHTVSRRYVRGWLNHLLEYARPASAPPDPADFRPVRHPYHNRYGDLTGVYLTEMRYVLAPDFTLPELPGEVSALVAQPRRLPDNDLVWNLDNPDSAPTYQSSPEPPFDLAQAAKLEGSSQAVQAAGAFLREHNLWVDDLLPPMVTAGSSTTDASGSRVTSWLVRFPQRGGDGSEMRGMGISVRVGPPAEVWSVTWRMYELAHDGLIRLRPLEEVLEDQQAWRDGSVSQGAESALAPTMRVQIDNVGLDWVKVGNADPQDEVARYLVPIYVVSLQVLEPTTAPGKEKGEWYLVAAADAER